MCSNYRPVTRTDRLLAFFGIPMPGGDRPDVDAWPGAGVPIIRLKPDSEALAKHERLMVEGATWRLVPDFVTTLAWARATYNARSEQIDEKRTFGRLWRNGQRCIMPAEWFYEPRYFGTVKKPGPSERWRIQQPGGYPMGIAGIYDRITNRVTGEIVFTAAMLTCNADHHPVMHVFHKPGDEKRMPVILRVDDYMDWLTCTPAEAHRYCVPTEEPLEIFSAPLPLREPRRPRKTAAKQDRPEEPGLF
jgi:putative SOS response-associated peptidase YedK